MHKQTHIIYILTFFHSSYDHQKNRQASTSLSRPLLCLNESLPYPNLFFILTFTSTPTSFLPLHSHKHTYIPCLHCIISLYFLSVNLILDLHLFSTSTFSLPYLHLYSSLIPPFFTQAKYHISTPSYTAAQRSFSLVPFSVTILSHADA